MSQARASVWQSAGGLPLFIFWSDVAKNGLNKPTLSSPKREPQYTAGAGSGLAAVVAI